MANHLHIATLSTCIVRPSTPTPPQHMSLTAADLVFRLLHHNRSILFFKLQPPISSSHHSLVSHLKSSLALALVDFFPLAGRLFEREEDGRLTLDCNDAGVPFIEAYVDLPFSCVEEDGFELDDPFAPPGEFDKLSGPDVPLLSVQVTRFQGDEGFILGFAQSHVCADGISFWHFMKSWGECARGIPLSMHPVHVREELRADKLRLLPQNGVHPSPPPMPPPPSTPPQSSEKLQAEKLILPPQGGVDPLPSPMPPPPPPPQSSEELRVEKLILPPKDRVDPSPSPMPPPPPPLPPPQSSKELQAEKLILPSQGGVHPSPSSMLPPPPPQSIEELQAEKLILLPQDRVSPPPPPQSSELSDNNMMELELVQRYFRFNGEVMRRLKQVANETAPSRGCRTEPISSLQAISAHMWRRVVAAGYCSGSKDDVQPLQVEGMESRETGLNVVANMRGRLVPPLPEGYFGNAVVSRRAVANVGEVRGERLGETAARVQEVIKTMDDGFAKGRWRQVEASLWSTSKQLLSRDMSTLHVLGSPRFPAYEVDFGWGSPACVRSPIRANGRMILCPAPQGGGSVDISVCLPTPIMNRLVQDENLFSV